MISNERKRFTTTTNYWPRAFHRVEPANANEQRTDQKESNKERTKKGPERVQARKFREREQRTSQERTRKSPSKESSGKGTKEQTKNRPRAFRGDGTGPSKNKQRTFHEGTSKQDKKSPAKKTPGPSHAKRTPGQLRETTVIYY